jgi:hypothetical protein
MISRFQKPSNKTFLLLLMSYAEQFKLQAKYLVPTAIYNTCTGRKLIPCNPLCLSAVYTYGHD